MSNEIVATHRTAQSDDTYQYRECGLDNVWLKGGFERVSSPYGDAVFIKDSQSLHECIALCLTSKPARLTGAEFRFLRTHLDLSQMMMGQLCGVSDRSVRGWESSDEPIGGAEDTIIRVIYRERRDPKTTYEGFAKALRELQAADKAFFEMKLEATANGWVRQSIDAVACA